jgi:hypothetical protein
VLPHERSTSNADSIKPVREPIDTACNSDHACKTAQEFDVDNRWGRKALERLYSDISGMSEPMPNVKVCHMLQFAVPSAITDPSKLFQVLVMVQPCRYN